MTAKIRFSYGKKVFNVGDEVPYEVAIKYPRLVNNPPTEKKEIVVEAKKEMSEEIMFSTQKVRKKKNEI